MDIRGHGKSPGGTAEFTIRQFSRDMVRQDHTRLIAENIPNAKLAIIEGDHFIAGKEPERFNEEVGQFPETIKQPATLIPGGKSCS